MPDDRDERTRRTDEGNDHELPAVPGETSRLRFDTEAATVELEHLYGYGDDDWTVTPAPGREGVGARWAAEAAASRDDVVDEGRSGHHAQLVPTYRALVAGEQPPVTISDTRGTPELAAAIYRSAFTGEPVAPGQITSDDPFYSSMAGTGAPWAPVKDGPATDGVLDDASDSREPARCP